MAILQNSRAIWAVVAYTSSNNYTRAMTGNRAIRLVKIAISLQVKISVYPLIWALVHVHLRFYSSYSRLRLFSEGRYPCFLPPQTDNEKLWQSINLLSLLRLHFYRLA